MNKKEVMKNNQEENPQYYVMNRLYEISVPNDGYSKHLLESMRCYNEPFPDGEVLFVEHHSDDEERTWFSSCRESLIAIKENRKKPLYEHSDISMTQYLIEQDYFNHINSLEFDDFDD